MTQETEIVLDRRQMRRSLMLWRTLAIAAAVLAVAALVAGGERMAGLVQPKQIARVAIEGTILENRAQLRMLEKIADSERVAALLIYVNSTGGTTTGGEALHEAIRRVAAKKPVVAQFGTVAASAGYIVGMGADHIVARGNTITGSIGVIVQWPEVVKLLDQVGIKVNELKSGDLKATPSPFSALDDKGRAVAQGMVDDSFRWFLGLVAERRAIRTADVPGLEQGRIFSGRQALAQKLVDEIGGEAEAIRWLETVRNVPKDLKLVDWKPRRADDWTLGGAVAALGGAAIGAGAAEMARTMAHDSGLSTLTLDGLISVWHPSQK